MVPFEQNYKFSTQKRYDNDSHEKAEYFIIVLLIFQWR